MLNGAVTVQVSDTTMPNLYSIAGPTIAFLNVKPAKLNEKNRFIQLTTHYSPFHFL